MKRIIPETRPKTHFFATKAQRHKEKQFNFVRLRDFVTLWRHFSARLLGLVVCYVFLTISAKSQVMLPDEKHPTKLGRTVYGLGFAAGAGTGLGVSFRHHLPSELSYQLVGGIIKVDRNLSFDVGAELQYDFLRGEMTRFFAGGGLAYFYSGDAKNNLFGPFRVAIGVGGEFSNIRLVHVTVEGMFTFFSDGTILPLPQISVHYYFF